MMKDWSTYRIEEMEEKSGWVDDSGMNSMGPGYSEWENQMTEEDETKMDDCYQCSISNRLHRFMNEAQWKDPDYFFENGSDEVEVVEPEKVYVQAEWLNFRLNELTEKANYWLGHLGKVVDVFEDGESDDDLISGDDFCSSMSERLQNFAYTTMYKLSK